MPIAPAGPDRPSRFREGDRPPAYRPRSRARPQIGMSSRALTAAEAARAIPILVARDGMAVVVHPTNPIRALTLAEVRSIYAGDRRSWRELGGVGGAHHGDHARGRLGDARGLRGAGDGRPANRGACAGAGLERLGAPDGGGRSGRDRLHLPRPRRRYGQGGRARRRRRQRGGDRRRPVPARSSLPVRRRREAGAPTRARSSTGSPAPKGATLTRREGLLPPRSGS